MDPIIFNLPSTTTNGFIFYYNRLLWGRFLSFAGREDPSQTAIFITWFLVFLHKSRRKFSLIDNSIFSNYEIGELFTEQSQNYNTYRISKLLLKYFQITKISSLYMFLTLEKRLSLIMIYRSRKTRLHVEKDKVGRYINHIIWPKALLGISCILLFYTVTFV